MSFLSIDGTLVVQLINFAIFFAVLSVVFLRPVASAIAKRRAYIDSLVSDYERYQTQAQGLRDEAEAVRAGARREAEHRISAARATASNEAAELATGYSQRAQGIVEQAQATAAGEFESARAGEGQAVRRIADLVLARVLPEATP